MSLDCILYKMGPHNPPGVRWGFNGGEMGGPLELGLTYTPYFPNSPMPPPTFQCPADLVHCRVMLPPPTREEHNNLSPDPLHSFLTQTSGLDGVRIQMGSRCAWARTKMQPWPVHFLPVPSPLFPSVTTSKFTHSGSHCL